MLVAPLIEARNYVTYKQCDGKWKNVKIGFSSETICSVGCLMSSVAMMLKTHGVSVNGKSADPASLNDYLKSHGGYVSGNLYVWNTIAPLGYSFQTNALNRNQVKSTFDQGAHLFLNVNHGGHWVLMTGYSGDTLYVNDPGFAKSSYGLGEVAAAGVYWKRNRLQ